MDINKLDPVELTKPYKPEDMDRLLSEMVRLSDNIKGFSMWQIFKGDVEVPNINEFTAILVSTVIKMGNSITYLQKDVNELKELAKQNEVHIDGDIIE